MTTQCKNCGAELTGPWCAQCGQKRIDRRLTIRSAASELFNAITNVERGFLFTIKEMFFRPGIVVGDYVSGRTKPYFPPFRFAFILVTLSVIVTVSSGVFDMQQDSLSQQWQVTEMTEEQKKFQETFGEYFQRFMNFFIIIMLPFYALASWLFTRKKGYNYAEHFVANTFLVGQTSLYGMLAVPIYLLLPDFTAYAMIASLLITVVVLAQLFRQWIRMPWDESIGTAVVATIFGQVVMVISMILLVAAVVLIMLLTGVVGKP
jgi:hypothetical protein